MTGNKRAKGLAGSWGLALVVVGSIAAGALGSDIPSKRVSGRDLVQPPAPPGVDQGNEMESLARSLAGLEPGDELLGRLAEDDGARAAMLAGDVLEVSPTPPWVGLSMLSRSVVPPIEPIVRELRSEGRKAAPPIKPLLGGVPIPEPASIILVVTGAIGLYMRGRLRRSMTS